MKRRFAVFGLMVALALTSYDAYLGAAARSPLDTGHPQEGTTGIPPW